MEIVRELIKSFVEAKKTMSTQHMYGLMVFGKTCSWFYDFTSNCDQFYDYLALIEPAGEFIEFNIGSLFEVLSEKIPDLLDRIYRSHFVYRVILIYSRSSVLPYFKKEEYKNIRDHIDFYLDAIYIHKKLEPASKGFLQKIYDFIVNLDSENPDKRSCYYFECSLSIRRLHQYFGYLLFHPLQRPEQKECKLISIKS